MRGNRTEVNPVSIKLMSGQETSDKPRWNFRPEGRIDIQIQVLINKAGVITISVQRGKNPSWNPNA